MRATILAFLLLVGCNAAHETVGVRSRVQPEDLPGTWTVTAIGTEQGRLTYEDVNRDHTYILGIECKRGNDSVTLLYYDRLPDGLAINVGDQLDIDTTDHTDFEPSFGGGFWVHDLVLKSQ